MATTVSGKQQLKDTLAGKPTVVTPIGAKKRGKPVVGVPVSEVLHVMTRLTTAVERVERRLPRESDENPVPSRVDPPQKMSAGKEIAGPPAVAALLRDTADHSWAVRNRIDRMVANVIEGLPLDSAASQELRSLPDRTSYGPSKDLTITITDNLGHIHRQIEVLSDYLLGQ